MRIWSDTTDDRYVLRILKQNITPITIFHIGNVAAFIFRIPLVVCKQRTHYSWEPLRGGFVNNNSNVTGTKVMKPLNTTMFIKSYTMMFFCGQVTANTTKCHLTQVTLRTLLSGRKRTRNITRNSLYVLNLIMSQWKDGLNRRLMFPLLI